MSLALHPSSSIRHHSSVIIHPSPHVRHYTSVTIHPSPYIRHLSPISRHPSLSSFPGVAAGVAFDIASRFCLAAARAASSLGLTGRAAAAMRAYSGGTCWLPTCTAQVVSALPLGAGGSTLLTSPPPDPTTCGMRG
mmetsp:Transcript_36949/g.59387  ORF Transcript_36949/g.59387 Transcript_36949/m.59387 type:complete len:136 (-) Transcript_36949:321-728(-)